ncbi:hypothetical protein [Hymenobacter sp. BT559]|uniref:hypothetical protein n=1 Tax=Hymenobacter sp. BT559 TaxID=2795729 RepID=UPI0018ED5517|nr:hypothetical protein [Hymenobacter sp. BT559]MBJ6145032.1 hypothetical protein [Hymenobacter sp. BT559]
MKSFAKISSLFALIIIGRYLQPAAIAPLATTRPSTPTVQALPLALARYTSTPLLKPKPIPEQAQTAQSQASRGYFL